MRYLAYKLMLVALVVVGTWQFGQGVYIHLKAMLAQELLEHAWLKTKSGDNKVKPWPWADTWPIARLSVPRLDVNLIVLAGDSGRTLAFGPGHNFASANPGEPGNSFISGHRDTHFRFLKDLQPGDRVLIETAAGQERQYRVERTRVVDARNTRVIVGEHQSRLSLITCYPFNSIVPHGPQRYIVSVIEQRQLPINNPALSLQQEYRHGII